LFDFDINLNENDWKLCYILIIIFLLRF
jgi:hypothetical protein